jgi:molybdate transport system permease protein
VSSRAGSPPASARLSPHEHTRRSGSGGGSRSAPLPLLIPALVAVGFLVIPLAGLILRAPWGSFWEILHGSQAGEALKL